MRRARCVHCIGFVEASKALLVNRTVWLGLLVLGLVVAAPGAGAQSDEAVVMDWWEEMVKDKQDASRLLDDADTLVYGTDGNLDSTQKSALDLKLTSALFHIEEVLTAPLPSGSVLEESGSLLSASPQSVLDYGRICSQLGREALIELESTREFDRDYVGSRLKTIRHLIERVTPHNYRTQAGIGQQASLGET
ncbi:MAG: hypothetical protein ACF8PN_04320 [Phycisphaerales bacterium]